MKKNILFLLSIFSLVALAGGIYLVYAFERRVTDFNNIIKLHHVENLREHLLLNIQKAEADLYSQGTMNPVSVDAIQGQVSAIDTSINACYECHHVASVLERINDLQKQIGQYEAAVGGVLALRTAPKQRLREAYDAAHLIGDSLIGKVETMVVLTNKKLNEQTADALRYSQKMKLVMFTVIAAGPLLMIIFALTVIRGVTGPLQVLVEATRKIKAGDLEHRITGLKDEFGELAIAFNDMAHSLRATMHAIEESEKRYRLLFESAADAIFILEAGGEQVGKIVQANQSAATMHGYTVDELTAMCIQDLDTPDAAAMIPSRIERIRQGEWIKAEVKHQKKDGSIFPVEISAGLFEVGGRSFILATDRDITDRKRAEWTLKRTERIRIAGELATGLAHEIKNPLAGIKVSMEALSQESYLPDEDRDVLNRVIGEIKRIEFLMKGLLNFAHPPKPQLVHTDVNAVLEAVAGLVLKDRARGREGEQGIRLVRELAQDLPEIMADPMQLQQIFLNLMLNAVDAMPQGGTMVVRTVFDRAENRLQIELSDTGSGIDAASMAKIFNPFFTTKAKGTGLGLSITRRLVEEHGGRIRLGNNKDGGVTCLITLPARQQEGAYTA